jgi:hypothetical protein
LNPKQQKLTKEQLWSFTPHCGMYFESLDEAKKYFKTPEGVEVFLKVNRRYQLGRFQKTTKHEKNCLEQEKEYATIKEQGGKSILLKREFGQKQE